MLHSRPQKTYSCSQPNLYAIVSIGWTSFLQYLSFFTDFSTRYDAAFGNAQLAALDVAQAMPDEYVREEVHKTLRLQMKALSETCMMRWMDMSNYIREAFPPQDYDNKRLAAGHAYYPGAQNQDWELVLTLMVSGQQFLDSNTAVLTTGGMPATFPASFATARTDYATRYQEYQQALEDSSVLTDQRIEANNALFLELREMFDDGKRIFRDNAAVRLQFNFDHILNTIDNGGSGGNGGDGPSTVFFGRVTDNLGNTVAGATVRLSNADMMLETQTDINGNYRLPVPEIGGPVSAMLAAEAMGMMPSSRPMTIAPGELQEQNFTLSPMAPAPPPPAP